MADPAAAAATQLKNIEARTGQTLAQLHRRVAASGLSKHGEIRSWLMAELGLGYGDANALAADALKARAPAPPDGADPLDAIYAGPKAALRPLHERVLAAAAALGPFEIAPKKSTVSLRRKKQFALVGPATKTELEVGLNARDLPPHPRLKVLPPGGMCAYCVRMSRPDEVDAAFKGWLQAAYDAAG